MNCDIRTFLPEKDNQQKMMCCLYKIELPLFFIGHDLLWFQNHS